jgi:hypothetical protein
MIRINKKLLLVVTGCVVTVTAMTQSFKFKAPLDSVTKNGFYKINVSAELSSHTKTDFSDIRIADAEGKWVPHIIKPALPFLSQNAFKEFPILSNTINDSGKTVLVIENKGSNIMVGNTEVKTAYEIVLFIKNAAVSRYAGLSGSNDQKHWFIVAENILLSKNYESKENYFIDAVSFNNSDYKYFKLVIDNEKDDPLNIIKAGSYYNMVYQSFSYSENNPPPVLVQKDSSDGRSYITIKNNAAFHVDMIGIDAGGAKFFERSATLYLPLSDSEENKIGYNPLITFKISSAADNSFSIKKIKAKIFYLVIDNKDNPPLKINSIATSHQINSIITYLEKGKQYHLLTGNEAATPPDYDLEKFKDSIPAMIDTLGIGAFIKIETPATVVQKNNNNKWWLWPSIIAAIVMLGFLSWKLLGDMKKTES